MILLPTAYFGNIEYFSKIISGENIVIESYETYPKQTYRNRCEIMGSNGVISLSVPIKHSANGRTLTKDVLIDYATSWQRNSWRGIISAYRNSPYFDHYEDLFAPFFTERFETLLEMNNKATEVILKILGERIDIKYSTDYIKKEDIDIDDCLDLRYAFSPKKKWLNRYDISYYQVFSDKISFAPNLSILDLIFCDKPNCINILKRSYEA